MTFPAMLRRLAARFTPATIVDVGASDGRWSEMARHVWPDAALILLEPNPVHFHAMLERLARIGGVSGHMPFLVGATEGTERVCFNSVDPFQAADPYAGGVEVPRCTIDMEAMAFAPPYLIKLDVHGREHAILEGARETLKQTGALIVEVYTWSQGANSMRAADLIPHIEREHGFLPSDLCEPMRRPLDGRLCQMDMLFEPRTAQYMDTARYR